MEDSIYRKCSEISATFVNQAQRPVRLSVRKGGFDFVHTLQTMTSHKASEVRCEVEEQGFDSSY